MTSAYMFPGQGSQKLGMGAELFDRFPDAVAAVDRALGYSIRELCLEDPRKQLDQTQFTQPALFVVCALGYRARRESGEGGQAPNYALGHSVGEYAALHAAGVFDLETGVRLVRKRGEIMSRAQGGGMAAVIGLSPAQIRDVIRNIAFDGIDLANFNAPEQTVIAGPAEQIDKIAPLLEEAGARLVIRLKVSGAFHSRLMREPSREFGAFLESVEFKAPGFPVISNLEARPYEPNRIREILTRQVCEPVRWVESIEYLLKLGQPTFEEIGPGKVLTKLVAQIRKT